jgi:hypothetical protein
MSISEEQTLFDSIVDKVKTLYVTRGEIVSRQEIVEAANNLVAFIRVLQKVKDNKAT